MMSSSVNEYFAPSVGVPSDGMIESFICTTSTYSPFSILARSMLKPAVFSSVSVFQVISTEQVEGVVLALVLKEVRVMSSLLHLQSMLCVRVPLVAIGLSFAFFTSATLVWIHFCFFSSHITFVFDMSHQKFNFVYSGFK